MVRGSFVPGENRIAIYSNALGMEIWEAVPHTLDQMQTWLIEERYARSITIEDCRQYVDLPAAVCADTSTS